MVALQEDVAGLTGEAPSPLPVDAAFESRLGAPSPRQGGDGLPDHRRAFYATAISVPSWPAWSASIRTSSMPRRSASSAQALGEWGGSAPSTGSGGVGNRPRHLRAAALTGSALADHRHQRDGVTVAIAPSSAHAGYSGGWTDRSLGSSWTSSWRPIPADHHGASGVLTQRLTDLGVPEESVAHHVPDSGAQRFGWPYLRASSAAGDQPARGEFVEAAVAMGASSAGSVARSCRPGGADPGLHDPHPAAYIGFEAALSFLGVASSLQRPRRRHARQSVAYFNVVPSYLFILEQSSSSWWSVQPGGDALRDALDTHAIP